MPLPHHHHRQPIPFIRLFRWLANLPNRLRCYVSGHWWHAYDLYTDKCMCCGAKRTLPVRRRK